MNLKHILGATLLGAAAFGAPARAATDQDFLPVDQAFHFEALPDGPTRVKLYWEIAQGYYLYRNRVSVTTEQPGVQLGALTLPKGESHTDEYFGTQEVYHQELIATQSVARAAGAPLQLKLTVKYQGCADAGLCYPPQKRQIEVELPASGAASGANAAGSAANGNSANNSGSSAGTGFISEQDRLASLVRSGNLGLLLGTFFLAGLLLAFTPCVLPMVPILSGIISGAGASSNALRGFLLSLAYVLGMAFTNTMAGVVAALAGKQVQALFQQPWIIAVFAGLFVVMALAMFGLFTLQMPAAIQTRLSDASNKQSAGTYFGVAVMGSLSALIVTACVAPPLVAALAVISQSGDVFRGGSALFAMSIGMGAPLLLVGASAGNLLPKAGAWMDLVKKLFGVLMLGVAAWMLARIVPEKLGLLLWAVPAFAAAWILVTGVRGKSAGALTLKFAGGLAAVYGAVLVAGSVLGGTDPLEPIPQLSSRGSAMQLKRIKTLSDLEREVTAARAAGKAVMLDFYADWCVSCKEMEKYTFTDAAVKQSLMNTVLLQADVTANDDDDAALLKRFDIKGPPTIAFYGPDGLERGQYRVVGFMKAPEFASVAKRATSAGT